MTKPEVLNISGIKIYTPRLILRKMEVSDAKDMFSYAKDEQLTKYLLWAPHESEDYTRSYLKYVQKLYKNGTFFDWAVVLRRTGKMIGTCGFAEFDPVNHSAQIGYVIHPEFQNCGYATEAAHAVIRYAFEKLLLHRVEARFMKGNEASCRVMQKLGMRYEGAFSDLMLVKGEYRTVYVYALLHSEYLCLREGENIQNKFISTPPISQNKY